MMSMLRRVALYAGILTLSVTVGHAIQPDVRTLGPQVGTTLPPFSGVDQFGRTQTLESVMGPAGAMVVLYRSADW
jgi:hypothetical protein